MRTDFIRMPKKRKSWEHIFFLKSILVGSIVVFLFYNSWIGIIFVIPWIPFCYKREKRNYQRKEQEKLKKEFREVIKLITRGLELGHSLEHCIEEAEIEYRELVNGKQTLMSQFLRSFTKKLQMNLSMQEILEEFAEQSQLEEAENFAEVVATAKKT